MIAIFIIISFVISLSVYLLKNNIVTKFISTIFLLLLMALNVYAYIHLNEESSIYFKFDSMGVVLMSILSILSIATFYHSYLYLKRHNFTHTQEAGYYAALMMLITAMTTAYFAENIAVLWVSIEATTLFVSVLIFFERTEEALEAAWKYLFISSVGVALAFIGILFLSMATTGYGFNGLSFSHLLTLTQSMNPNWLKIAFLLVLTGYSAKMGVFPLYTVTVDAHTVAPPPISAFISTTLMNVGFLGIFRVFVLMTHTPVLHWVQNVLLIVGTVSILMSSIQLLRIKHYKRLYAFSSLEHMGIVALGLGVGGIGYYAALLHIVFHSFIKAGLFYQIGQVHNYFKSYWIKDAAGYFKLNPVGALMLIFGFVSILAIPPSGMFITEFLTLKAMFLNKHYVLGIFILILLSIIIYSFSKNILHLLYGETEISSEYQKIKPNYYETVSQFILFSLVVYLGINPPAFLTDLINDALAILN